jgi:hypothetical protein
MTDSLPTSLLDISILLTCHPGEKNTGIEPHPAHAFPTAERFVVVVSTLVVYLVAPAKNPPVPAYNVPV